MEKVFGYVRVSTDTQAKSGYGAEAQEQAIIDYCKRNGLELVKVFRDLGVTGTTVDRDGLTDLLSSFNGVTKVVVLNTSRLWRNDTTMGLIKFQMSKLKADVISIEQPTYSIYTKDPSDYLINGMLQLLDEYERMTVNLKLARGRKSKAKSGVKACGECPIGYKWQHDGVEKPIVVVDPETAPIVKEIFSQYVALGSIGKVRKYLAAKGYKTKRGNDFNDMSIRNILTNEFYTGKVTWNDIEVDGQHEPLVSRVTFGKIQAQLKRNNKRVS
jgi:site-specific DNA recombinase